MPYFGSLYYGGVCSTSSLKRINLFDPWASVTCASEGATSELKACVHSIFAALDNVGCPKVRGFCITV